MKYTGSSVDYSIDVDENISLFKSNNKFLVGKFSNLTKWVELELS